MTVCPLSLALCIPLLAISPSREAIESPEAYVAEMQAAAEATVATGNAPSMPTMKGAPIPIILDAERSKRIGNALVNSEKKYFFEIGQVIIGYMPAYITQADAPKLKRPLDYVAFVEVFTVLQEALAQRGSLERARLNDPELREMGIRNLCKGPMWYLREGIAMLGVESEAAAKRHTPDSLKAAMALRDRFEARKRWYESETYQRQCRDLDSASIAP